MKTALCEMFGIEAPIVAFSHCRSNALLDVAFSFPGVRAMVSAIGTPPPEILERAHARGIKVGAMVGQVKHAIRQRDAGVDFVVAQGHEAGELARNATQKIDKIALRASAIADPGKFWDRERAGVVLRR